MIEKEKIDAIKRTVDIKSLIESKGIQLKKNGKGYFGRCPFHDDKTPSLSVNTQENLWQCFGCDKGGDVIRFVELFDHVDFKEAVNRLSDGHDIKINPSVINPAPESSSRQENPQARQYLERVVAIYENNFTVKADAKKYLEIRNITDAGLFTKHAVGFCDGMLNDILPGNGDIRDVLKQIGILLENGSERFKNCVVFPVCDPEGQIITLYGRCLDEKSGKKHVFLPNRPTGLWNCNIIKSCSEIILTESIIDALSVQVAGFNNVISIQSTNGLSEREIMELQQYGVRKLVLLLDGDAAGKKAAERLKEKLSEFVLDIKILPDTHDPNSFLMAHGADKLGKFISTDDNTAAPVDSFLTAPEASVNIQPQADGFVVTLGLRKYRIMGLEKGPRKLKATVRMEHAGKLHVDTLDFYSARSRKILCQDICRVFEELPETIESDIARLVSECENAVEKPEKDAGNQPKLIVSGKDKEQAETFGKSPDLVNRILADFKTCGLIGEEANKLLGYIAMTSRKRKEPLSVQILSSSGSGKTALQDAVVNFCPPEDLVKLTSLSGKALFYKEQASLKHKVLALEEGNGAEDASYAIRSLISSGVLINETTIKDLSTGRLTTMENRVEGPTAVFYTTTNPDVDPETKSRFFVTGIDESREQTRKILAYQREKHHQDDITESIKTEAVIKRHINFQRMLKPLGVQNPYSSRLTYADDRLQGRRDQPKYLNLIKSVAFLHQMQKDIKYSQKNGKSVPFVEADVEDIRIANKLAREILGRSLDELSRPGRDLLMLLDEMVEKQWQKITGKETSNKLKRTDIGFTRRDIREYTGWSNYRVHTHLKELVHLEYILVESGKNGSPYSYRLAYEGQGKDGSKFILGLTSPEELQN